MPFNWTPRTTTIFLILFTLAFFPNLAQDVLGPILRPLNFFSNLDVEPPLLPTCNCCPPASCNPKPSTPPQATHATMSWTQKQFTLPSKSRGSYLITDEIVSSLPELKSYKVGILHLFIQHTSCGLSLNENWDTDVREDMSDALDRIAPEDKKGNLYRHSAEGADDMPAHIKSALVGASVTVPITEGGLNTGTWQGIWYLEFRRAKHSRKVVATIQGEKYEGKGFEDRQKRL